MDMSGTVVRRNECTRCSRLKVASWTSKVLVFTSFVIFIIALTRSDNTYILYIVYAIVGLLSPLTYSCIWKRAVFCNTSCKPICVDGLFVWLFVINLVCGCLLPGLGFLYGHYYYYQNSKALTLLLIAYAVANSVLILYTICLVSKFGWHFIEGQNSELSNTTVYNGSQAFQVAVPHMDQRLNTSVQACPTAVYQHLTGVTNFTQSYAETRQQTVMSGQNIDCFVTSQINIPPQNIDYHRREDLPPPYSHC